jgi:hypothetical protein
MFVHHRPLSVHLVQADRQTKLKPDPLAALRREFVARSVPTKETWWGYDTLQVDDPDGNELFFPRPD